MNTLYTVDSTYRVPFADVYALTTEQETIWNRITLKLSARYLMGALSASSLCVATAMTNTAATTTANDYYHQVSHHNIVVFCTLTHSAIAHVRYQHKFIDDFRHNGCVIEIVCDAIAINRFITMANRCANE